MGIRDGNHGIGTSYTTFASGDIRPLPNTGVYNIGSLKISLSSDIALSRHNQSVTEKGALSSSSSCLLIRESIFGMHAQCVDHDSKKKQASDAMDGAKDVRL